MGALPLPKLNSLARSNTLYQLAALPPFIRHCRLSGLPLSFSASQLAA